MADKSCYMGAGGYGSGYMGGASNTGYAREEYASSGNGQSAGFGGGQAANNNAGGNAMPPGVTKPRTDQSCYLGP